MRRIVHTTKFKKDYRRADKQHRDLMTFRTLVAYLAEGKHPPSRYRPHKLKGEFLGCWECHLEFDLLLIYKIEPDAVYLVRMGTHSELFA
jgi:mRNA interferase YafQ